MDEDMRPEDWKLLTLLDLPDFECEDDEEYLPEFDVGLEDCHEGDTIARRTRSKYPIAEEPGQTFEFPDSTKELDDEWKEFLASLYRDNPSNIFEEDEAQDPDYNEFEDVDELIEHETDRSDPITAETTTDSLPIDFNSVSSKDLSEWSKLFTKEDIELLFMQMSQHVQILSQQYLLTMTSQTLTSVAENSAKLLREIKTLADDKPVTLFRPPNLSDAIKIIENHPINPSNITVIANSWRQCPVPLIARPIFASNPSVFLHHDILPKSGYPDVHAENKSMKTAFTDSEDHLIAMGLEQFKNRDKRIVYRLIREHLMPTKTEHQLKMHVKNKRRHLKEDISDPSAEKNPITYFFRFGKLMPTTRRRFLPPRYNYSDLVELPPWLAKELDPKYSMPALANKLPTRLKLSPVKSVSCKFNYTLSPHKQTCSILKKYRYLSKYPYIRPKPSSQDVPTGVFKDIKEQPLSNSTLNESASLIVNTRGSKSNFSKISTPKDFPAADTRDESIKIIQHQPSPEKTSGKTTPEDNTPQNSPTGSNSGSNRDQSYTENVDAIMQNEDDDESDLAALMVASSTIMSNKSRNKSHDSQNGVISKKETKKSQNARHRESTGLLLSEDWSLNDCTREQKEQVVVQLFMNKVRQVLKSDEDYMRFLTYLNEFGQQRRQKNSLRDLHHKTEQLLCKANAQQIMEEFVLLLTASEAQDCGKMYEYLHWRRYLSFIRKLEIYSLVEPNCISRLYKSLIQLKSSETPVDKQKLRTAVSKAIGGHPYLMNEFSTLFLDEKPKDFLFACDEDFDHPNPLSEDLNSVQTYESVSLDLTQEERKYGTNECPCKVCHTEAQLNEVDEVTPTVNGNEGETERRPNQTSTSLGHCVACSIRFIGGKVYLQGPRKVQPAEVQYLDKEYCSQPIIVNNVKTPDETVQLKDHPSPPNVVSCSKSPPQICTDTEKTWSKEEDKFLLENIKAKVNSGSESNMNEVFIEISDKLRRSYDDVVNRFNRLIELFKSESKNSQTNPNSNHVDSSAISAS